jgi:sarcosine oxidase subunit alpha
VKARKRLQPGRDNRFGRLIDRATPLHFTFDGRTCLGFAGDTIASALLANGVQIVGRGARFGRPRGIIAIGADEPNAFLTVADAHASRPNVQATTTPLIEGMAVTSGHGRSRFGWNPADILDHARPFMPAGFYYKAFKWPAKASPFYERLLRRAVSAGRAPASAGDAGYEHVHLHADVLVVGGGLAGLAAAEAAASRGLSVVLAEADCRLGGMVDAYDGRVEGVPLLEWTARKSAGLAASGNIHILHGTTAIGLFEGGQAVLVERVSAPGTDRPPLAERLWKLRAKAIIVATGATEKPLMFPGNDRPGVMLATGARLFARRYGVLPGQRFVIATSGDEGYRTAADISAAGGEVVRIADLRIQPDGSLFHISKAHGLSVSPGTAPVGTNWRRRGGMNGATLANRLTFDAPALEQRVECDTVLVSGGWSPSLGLVGQLGVRLGFDESVGGFHPKALPPGLFTAGGVNGILDAAPVLQDGWRAGEQAAAYVLGAASTGDRVQPSDIDVDITWDEPAEAVGMLPDIASPEQRSTAFVDFRQDVTVADLHMAAQEGYTAPEHLKRYVKLGQGLDQGKMAASNAAMVQARLKLGDSVQHTTSRPPLVPVSLALLAAAHHGTHPRQARTTPLSSRLKSELLQETGGWLMASAFPQGNEDHESSVRREVLAARHRVGMLDAGSSARIIVDGPDAERFLGLVSSTKLDGIPIGASRPAALLDEDGFLRHQIEVSRISASRFIVSAGIEAGAGLCEWLERWRSSEGPALRVALADETECLGRVVLVGPNVPALLSNMTPDFDVHSILRGASFRGELLGTEMHLHASSHTGAPELEIALPAGYVADFCAQVAALGAPLGLTPIGLGALRRLQLEAGLIPGQVLTEKVTPFDLGLDRLVDVEKPEFVGKRGLSRPALSFARHRIHGALPVSAALLPPVGASLVLDPEKLPPRTVVGHICASGYSPTLRRPIALALVGTGHIEGTKTFIIQSGAGQEIRFVDRHFLAREHVQ